MSNPDPAPTSWVTAVRGAGRSLFALPTTPASRFWVAVRAAVSMALPFGVFTLFGQEGFGLQTAAGAFTSIFAASAPVGERAKVLPFVAAGLLGSAALGAFLVPWPVLSAVGLILVAVVTSALAFAYRLGPPGPVFFTLAYGLASVITGVHDGARLTEPWPFLGALAIGVAFSYLVALLPWLRPENRAAPVRPLRRILPGPYLGPGELELIARIAVVSVCGLLISAIWLNPQRSYWAVATGVAVIGLAAGRSTTLTRALHRTLGTLIGVGAFILLEPLAQYPLVLVALFAVLQFVIEMVVVRNYGLALVVITPLVLLISTTATGPEAAVGTVGERMLDTVIGSGLALATVILYPGRSARAV